MLVLVSSQSFIMNLSDVKKLHQKKYRQQFARYLIEGEHLLLELDRAIANRDAQPEIQLFVTENYFKAMPALNFEASIEIISDKQMKQISDTKTPQGVVAVVPLALFDAIRQCQSSDKAVYLYEIQDPGNLGTIIRSLTWFGGFRLILSPNSVDAFNPKVIRACMGANFHLSIEQDVEISQLADRYRRFAYLDMRGEPLNSATFSQYDCYIFGNEARGVPHALLNALDAKAYTIGGCGAIDSLNLATAVSISAFQLQTQ